MRWFWAVAGALLLAAGVVWWMDHDPDPGALRADRHPRAAGIDRGPTLYRWVDAAGVVNITDAPPKGRHYTVVRIDPNRNIVPMSTPAQQAAETVPAHRPR